MEKKPPAGWKSSAEWRQLVEKIEEARAKLNASIEKKEDYEIIYQNSVRLDGFIEQYIVAEEGL